MSELMASTVDQLQGEDKQLYQQNTDCVCQGENSALWISGWKDKE